MDEDDVLIKSSEGDAGASDKTVRGIRSGRELSVVKIAKQSTRVDIGIFAGGDSMWQ